MTYTFTVLPAIPTAEHRAACRADALALLDVTAPAEPHETLDPSDAGDTAVRPGDVVYLLDSNPNCRLYVRVVKVLCNDMLLVRDLVYGAVQWKVSVEDVALALVSEAAEVGEVG